MMKIVSKIHALTCAQSDSLSSRLAKTKSQLIKSRALQNLQRWLAWSGLPHSNGLQGLGLLLPEPMGFLPASIKRPLVFACNPQL
jgi:hypothetical protein